MVISATAEITESYPFSQIEKCGHSDRRPNEWGKVMEIISSALIR